jgi:hypothetical protein
MLRETRIQRTYKFVSLIPPRTTQSNRTFYNNICSALLALEIFVVNATLYVRTAVPYWTPLWPPSSPFVEDESSIINTKISVLTYVLCFSQPRKANLRIATAATAPHVINFSTV